MSAAQHAETAQHAGDHTENATHGAEEGFDAGTVIIEHVSNSSHDHPVLHLPHIEIAGIDFSITKHVMMMWLVAGFLFLIITMTTRRFLAQERPIPTGLMTGLEWLVQSIRDSIVLPNVGAKWVNTWTPVILTLFLFILMCNAVGLIPIFEVFGLVDRYVLGNGYSADSMINSVLHGGTTATANYNVTAALATITFFSIMIAGTMAHGFIHHWKNLVPPGLAWPVYILLIPIEFMGLFVKPFALTMRLAANMTGGHIAILSILSLVFIFTQVFESAALGVGVGFTVAVPLAVGISALEIIVVMVQAYVFTLLTSVFIGMAINVHH
ncbi:MAG: ATP synthase F0 subunit A [Acidobacteria bacterium]|nr:ATP synthase F0 subunit A [Acidobacteriota bacterium]|tara:strand:+ start:1871 stop:2845 length:975 start_codon:yes stop_codon:yes gene_type:complete